MVAAEIPPIGTDLFTPDFQAVARGYGLAAHRAGDPAHLGALLREAGHSDLATLIAIDAPSWPGGA